jgi:hypothetical protein
MTSENPMTHTTISTADVARALAAAVVTMAAMPRATPNEVAAARQAWTWLAIHQHETQRKVLKARAAGATLAAIARHAGVSESAARRIHADGLAAIAARLNGALAE